MISRNHKKLEKSAGKVVNIIAKYFIKAVNPKWLQGIDRHLLLNRPKFWSLKLHYILYYALIADSLIAFLVRVFPISSPTQLFNLLITGFVIIPIGETILLFYWLYIQFLLNRERQYGHIRKWNGLLELLSYSVCITLIASGLIVFYGVTLFKVKPVIPRTQLAIDLITLDAIQREGLEDSKDYFQALKNYVNSDEFNNLQKESIFSEKYNDKKQQNSKIELFEQRKGLRFEEGKIVVVDREKYINFNSYYGQNLPNNQLCFLSENNDSLRRHWYQIEQKTRIFVEYDNSNLFFNYGLYEDLRCSLFKDLSNKKDIELLKKSSLNHLVEKIKKNKLEEVINPMLKYAAPGNIDDVYKFYNYIKKNTPAEVNSRPPSIRNSPVILAADVVRFSARDLYQIFYTFTTFQEILFWYYLLLNLILLLLLLFYSTYMVDFIFALVYIFVLVAVLWFAAGISSSSLSLKPEKVMLVFIFLPTIIIFFLAFSRRKIKRYWRFKVLNLVAFPFAVLVSVYSIIELLERNNIFPMNNERIYIYAYIYRSLALLSYIPIVLLLKNELLRQLKLPKD